MKMQGNEEEEMDVMLQISKMPLSRILGVRSQLRELRESLNKRSFGLLEGFLDRACKDGQGG